jgi:hypothetical protein
MDVKDPDEFAKASMAQGDYEVDRSWLKGITTWAEGRLSMGYEAVLSNEGQINKDPREQPCVTSLDLGKPDYLSKTFRSAP